MLPFPGLVRVFLIFTCLIQFISDIFLTLFDGYFPLELHANFFPHIFLHFLICRITTLARTLLFNCSLIVFCLLSLYDKCMHSVCEQFGKNRTQRTFQHKLALDKETRSECSFSVFRQFSPTCWRSAYSTRNNVESSTFIF